MANFPLKMMGGVRGGGQMKMCLFCEIVQHLGNESCTRYDVRVWRRKAVVHFKIPSTSLGQRAFPPVLSVNASTGLTGYTHNIRGGLVEKPNRCVDARLH